jgi:hypothetical protein
VNRRSAVVAAAVSLLALSSCATFNRNDVAASVGSHSLSSAGARALVTPDDQHTIGDLLRQQMTAWIKLDVVDEQQAKAQYDKGLAGSQSICLGAIPVVAIADTKPVLAALQSGMSFADAARQFSANQALAAGGGIVLAPDGTECMPPTGLAQAVADALKTTPVGQPIAADLGSFSAVLLLRPYSDLSFQARSVVAAASVSELQLAALLAGAHIYVDPRYGRWNAESLSVVPLTS